MTNMPNNNNKKKRKKKLTKRFLAMSKLIGIFIAMALASIITYSMYEMHVQHDLSSLSQLIISVFSIAAAYIGFYLTMAKWEHLESEKTNRQKDLLRLKKELELISKKEQMDEQIENFNKEITELDDKLNEVESEDFTNNNY